MTSAESRSVGAVTVPTTIHERVGAAAAKAPDAPALSDDRSTLTYGQLAAAAAAWTRILLAVGVQRGDVVAVISRRSVDLPAALLGILGAGGCYSIVDPDWPAERQRELITRMGARTCLIPPGPESTGLMAEPGDVRVLPLRPAAELTGELGAGPITVSPDDPACVFWTSGSTGKPKGVLSPHRATTRLFGHHPHLRGGPGSVMVSIAAPAWDGFSLELWSMLTTGGHAVMHAERYFLPTDLRAAIDKHKVTDLFLTSGLFDAFVAEDIGAFEGLQFVSVGGDRLSPVHAETFLDAFPGIPLVNGYGPVECCAFVTTHQVTHDDVRRPEGIPVGTAVPGTEVFLVSDGKVVPRGEVGEIWVTGQGVGLGYLADPERTQESFAAVSHGMTPGRYYRTGDRATMTEDGIVLFLGRLDRQVKIGGVRIEPAEIEAKALQLGCKQAAVIPVHGDHGCRGLALFAAPGPHVGTSHELHAILAGHLPAPMVPWPITFVDELPLTASGKVDRARLERWTGGGSVRGSV